MRIILHIGTHKTGTSSIQAVCHSMRATLLEQGILYPTITPYNRHSILVIPFVQYLPREFARRFDKNKEQANIFAQKMWGEIKNEVCKNKQINTIVLSSEHFANVTDVSDFMDKVRSLAAKSEIDIICYLRRPDDRYLSGVQQTLKGKYQLDWPKNSNLLPDLGKWDGLGRLILTEFDRSKLFDGDVVSDFLKCIGAKIPSHNWANLRNENISLSAEAMAATILYRKNMFPNENGLMFPEIKQLGKIMKSASADLPDHFQPTKAKLKPEIRLAALVAAQKKLVILRDDFGFVFSDSSIYDFEAINEAFFKTGLSQGNPPELHNLVEYDQDKLMALYSAIVASFLRRQIRKQKLYSSKNIKGPNA